MRPLIWHRYPARKEVDSYILHVLHTGTVQQWKSWTNIRRSVAALEEHFVHTRELRARLSRLLLFSAGAIACTAFDFYMFHGRLLIGTYLMHAMVGLLLGLAYGVSANLVKLNRVKKEITEAGGMAQVFQDALEMERCFPLEERLVWIYGPHPCTCFKASFGLPRTCTCRHESIVRDDGTLNRPYLDEILEHAYLINCSYRHLPKGLQTHLASMGSSGQPTAAAG